MAPNMSGTLVLQVLVQLANNVRNFSQAFMASSMAGERRGAVKRIHGAKLKFLGGREGGGEVGGCLI